MTESYSLPFRYFAQISSPLLGVHRFASGPFVSFRPVMVVKANYGNPPNPQQACVAKAP
jgi:hypothetical protein